MLSVLELLLILRSSRFMKPLRRRRLLLLLVEAVERPRIPDVRFDLDDFNDAELRLKFRFKRAGILQLVRCLRLPDIVLTSARDSLHAVEAICIVLHRLSYPKRYCDIIDTFGRSREALCRVFNHMVSILYAKWHETIYFCPLTKNRLSLYAKAITDKGSPVSCLFGFIDGSKFETCRINQGEASEFRDLQRYIYSGHKRRHCLNFQAVTSPDGLCIHFWGPLEGSRHDTTMLRMSKLMDYLTDRSDVFENYYLYGDPAYGVLKLIFSGYKSNSLSPQQAKFNSTMSTVRQSVEWWFARVKTVWSFITCKMQQKIMLQSVGKVISVAMLLTNCQCCYEERNQISIFFNLKPLSLEDYLSSPSQ